MNVQTQHAKCIILYIGILESNAVITVKKDLINLQFAINFQSSSQMLQEVYQSDLNKL